MNFLKLLKSDIVRVSSNHRQPLFTSLKRFRKSSPCLTTPPDKRPCFDINNIIFERGSKCHSKFIRSFLYTHYWPREPSVVGLWMALDCPYLEVLTDKFSNSGDRFLAFERIERTQERKLIGVIVANKVWPWMIAELQEWAHYSASKPERHRMYFCAHCLKAPNLFQKYNVPYIYDVEVLGTAAEATGQGVATHLLGTALLHAQELRHPLVQLVSLSKYTEKCAERVGMKREWSMNYTDFVDGAGQRVFFPRSPHNTVSIYCKLFDQSKKCSALLPSKPPFLNRHKW